MSSIGFPSVKVFHSEVSEFRHESKVLQFDTNR
ncbi:hypothetical protein T4A_1906 [Trichinella pseudospiralis]|uniref:Uncharacterized protein n=1 Tax=Trichinella pseudospiralis TaxID=6337 RepID=A0A0V1C7M4_TRIPS|nr:hypothetical protein T4A_1906 [Trichinella pseudospiralis]